MSASARAATAFCLDDAGNLVYHPQQQLIYSGLKSEDTAALAGLDDGVYDNGTVITCVNSVGDSGWRVVSVSYVDELVDRNMAEMLQLSCVLGALVLACALLTSWVLSRLLTRPLRGWPMQWRALRPTPTTSPTTRWAARGRCGSFRTPSAIWCCASSS